MSVSQIEGFVSKASYVKNESGVVNDFFELSPLALTYSKTVAEYQSDAYSDSIVTVFSATNPTNQFVVDQPKIDKILEVVSKILLYKDTYTAPYNLPDFQNFVAAEMASTTNNLALGAIVIGMSESLPEWVSFTSEDGTWSAKLWINTTSFEAEYLGYTIVPVKPIDSLDSFFTSYSSSVGQLTSVNYNVFDRITEAKGAFPETYVRGFYFSYVNPANPDQSTKVMWPVLVYGRNGDNIDSIKDAIADFVIANSTHTRLEWQAIFPEIFQRTEFLFLPRWDKVAIPNLTQLSALYSSIQEPLECVAYSKDKWDNIAAAWVENNLFMMPFDYKNIMLLGIPGTTNVAGASNIKLLFSDYIPEGTGTLDFNRMKIETKEWVLIMIALIHAAETASDSVGVANPMRKIIRDGITYVSRVYNNVNYMVATKASLESIP